VLSPPQRECQFACFEAGGLVLRFIKVNICQIAWGYSRSGISIFSMAKIGGEMQYVDERFNGAVDFDKAITQKETQTEPMPTKTSFWRGLRWAVVAQRVQVTLIQTSNFPSIGRFTRG
jgi:hypothetical protein